MNAEDQTAMVAIAMEDEFGEENVVEHREDLPETGHVHVLTEDDERAEELLEEHCEKEADNHGIDLQYRFDVTKREVAIRDIRPVALEE